MFLYSRLVNRVLVGRNLHELWLIIAGYLGTFLLTTLGIAASRRYSNQLMLKYDLRIKHKLLNTVLHLDYEDYSRYSVGDVRGRIEQDAAVAGRFFTTHILEFIYSVVYAAALAVILLCYDWRIALLSFIFVPVSLWTVHHLGRNRGRPEKSCGRCRTHMNPSCMAICRTGRILRPIIWRRPNWQN